MKQFIIIFPKAKAFEFAAYAYTNEVRVILSWLEESEFFSLSNKKDGVHAVCIASEEITTKLMNSEWKQFVQP